MLYAPRSTYRPTHRRRPDGFVPPAVGKMGAVLVALFGLFPGPALAAPSAPGVGLASSWWGALLLGLVVGAGAVGLLHWLRLRRVQQRAEDQDETLRAEKREAEAALQETETALEAATNRAETLRDRAEKLKQISAAKSEFLEEVSHAFRRPLTLTLGPIDTLLEGRYGELSEEVRTQLRLAQRSGTRVLWLAGQLLDLAELETGSMTLSPREGNLSSFVARSLRSFEGLAERRGVRLGFESSLEETAAFFDEQKLETMLANLLSSAFRATEEDGAVRVILRPAESEEASPEEANSGERDDVELVVEHTGTDLGTGEEAFDWTGDEQPLEQPGGVSASVGLYLVDELADLHGGRFWTETEGENDSRFVVRLPRKPSGDDEVGSEEPGVQAGGDTIPRFLDGTEKRGTLELSRRALANTPVAEEGGTPPLLSPNPAEGADQATRRPIPGEEALPGTRTPSVEEDGGDAFTGAESPANEDRTTVLVIDDNSVICTLVRSHLEPEYRVEEAHDGAEGYTLARTLLPDLVITDVMMPEVDGFELCRKIKEDPDIDHVPVVFLTACADLEDRVEGYDTGADAYLTKPFEPEALIARVESLIEMRQALRESFRAGEAATGSAGGMSEGASGEAGLSAAGIEQAEAALPPTAEDGSLEQQVEEAIAEHLTDPEFGVSELAEATALSASQLRRRMKGLYDRTPVQLIRRRRLEAGARLLREREEATIGEVAFAVGFNSQSYFSRSFREEFGTSPSRYRKDGVAA